MGNNETFENIIKNDPIVQTKFKDHRFKNPFHDSIRKGLVNGKYKGYLREWKVFEFDENVVTQCGWGVKDSNVRITICYRNGQLGIALRYYTGRTYTVNTLITTRRSMYAR